MAEPGNELLWSLILKAFVLNSCNTFPPILPSENALMDTEQKALVTTQEKDWSGAGKGEWEEKKKALGHQIYILYNLDQFLC